MPHTFSHNIVPEVLPTFDPTRPPTPLNLNPTGITPGVPPRPLARDEYEYLQVFSRYISQIMGIDYSALIQKSVDRSPLTPQEAQASEEIKRRYGMLSTGAIPRTATGQRDFSQFGVSLDTMYDAISGDTLLEQATVRTSIILPEGMQSYANLYARYFLNRYGVDPNTSSTDTAGLSTGQRSLIRGTLQQLETVMDALVSGENVEGLTLPTVSEMNASLAQSQAQPPSQLSPSQQRQQDAAQQQQFANEAGAWWMRQAFGTFREEAPEGEKAPEREDVAPELSKIYQDALAGLTPNQQRYFESRIGRAASGFGGDLAEQMTEWWDTRTLDEQKAQRTLDVANTTAELQFYQGTLDQGSREIREFIERMRRAGYFVPEDSQDPTSNIFTEEATGMTSVLDSPWANVYKDLLVAQTSAQQRVSSLSTSLGTLGTASLEDVYGQARTADSPFGEFLGDFPFAEQYANLSPQQRGLRTSTRDPRTRFLLY